MKKAINQIKKIFTLPALDRTLSHFTQKKDIDNFLVKLLPSNLDYKSNAVRRKNINGITYDLYLSQWMEYALYFGIAAEDKNALYQLVKPGMTIIDVGVNFGETLLNFSKFTGSNGQVYGFEPMPYIYQKCLHNISLNQFKNITLENLALSDQTEKLIINDPMNGNSGGTFVSRNPNPNPGKITINALTLDQYVSQHQIKNMHLIKIDVEGFETNVLRGAMQTLTNFKPILYIELSDQNLKRAGSSSIELIKLLQQHQYDISEAETQQPITPQNLSNYLHTDIIAISQP
ncbi:MAG: FkbM family methyltransferase [Bacteroidia bacterium]